ncbi:hypothetical protein BDQ12DRAFT_712794 [Crucibulum laeve]|uniref:Uncharacterized protein n=1 Tax=Crucibulum laeve TaxID=68775 RepID=A0A5C3LYR3_9AGAR|nr:hypothetical protein BDQ12DRAFT_712794 [Crucibulum laeve]
MTPGVTEGPVKNVLTSKGKESEDGPGPEHSKMALDRQICSQELGYCERQDTNKKGLAEAKGRKKTGQYRGVKLNEIMNEIIRIKLKFFQEEYTPKTRSWDLRSQKNQDPRSQKSQHLRVKGEVQDLRSHTQRSPTSNIRQHKSQNHTVSAAAPGTEENTESPSRAYLKLDLDEKAAAVEAKVELFVARSFVIRDSKAEGIVGSVESWGIVGSAKCNQLMDGGRGEGGGVGAYACAPMVTESRRRNDGTRKLFLQSAGDVECDIQRLPVELNLGDRTLIWEGGSAEFEILV